MFSPKSFAAPKSNDKNSKVAIKGFNNLMSRLRYMANAHDEADMPCIYREPDREDFNYAEWEFGDTTITLIAQSVEMPEDGRVFPMPIIYLQRGYHETEDFPPDMPSSPKDDAILECMTTLLTIFRIVQMYEDRDRARLLA